MQSYIQQLSPFHLISPRLQNPPATHLGFQPQHSDRPWSPRMLPTITIPPPPPPPPLLTLPTDNGPQVPPDKEIKFKTTKLIEGAKGGRCAVTETPTTGFTYLCVAVTRQLVLMQWCVRGGVGWSVMTHAGIASAHESLILARRGREGTGGRGHG